MNFRLDPEWKQGSILPIEAHIGLQSSTSNNEQRYVVTPYTCVLAHANKQTQIDLICLKPCDFDNNFAFGKSLKEIHVYLEIDTQMMGFSATPNDRCCVPAEFFLSMPDNHRQAMSYWLASRFNRNAFPDEFNDALKPKKNQIKAILKKITNCKMVLVSFKLNNGSFDSVFTLVISKTDEDKRQTERDYANKHAEELEREIRKCPKLESTEVIVQSTEETSFEQYLTSWHFDSFDDISFSLPNHRNPKNSAGN